MDLSSSCPFCSENAEKAEIKINLSPATCPVFQATALDLAKIDHFFHRMDSYLVKSAAKRIA
jgi:hypothetical protein